MNIQTIVILAALGLLAALAISAGSIRKIIQIRRTPTTWISALPAAGRVEIKGNAGENTTTAHFSGAPCVFWQLEVQERKNSGKGGYHWDTVYKECSLEPFEISDETGKVCIQPRSADLRLEDDLFNENLDMDTKVKLEKMGIQTTGGLFGSEKTLNVYERRIQPGDALYVIGEALTQGSGKVIVAGSTPLLISDKDEGSLLQDLYKKVGMNFLLTAVVVVVVIFGLVSNH